VRAPARADARASPRAHPHALLTAAAQDAEDRAVGAAVQQALLPAVRAELFPKATLDVLLTVLQADGADATAAAATLAAGAALADAGIEMLGLVVACSAVRAARARRGEVLMSVHRRWWATRRGSTPTRPRLRARAGRSRLRACPRSARSRASSRTGTCARTRACRCVGRRAAGRHSRARTQLVDACMARCEDIHAVVAQALLEAQAERTQGGGAP
jgi:exosome complex component MTR3